METVDMLARLQKEDPRLRIHSNTVAMSENMDEIWELTEYLHDHCPAIEQHNLAIIRGDRKNPSLQGPALDRYKKLYEHVAEVWKDREEGRFGSVAEPMLQWAKVKTIETGTQYVPCRAGILSGVFTRTGMSVSARRTLRSGTCARRVFSKSGIRQKPKCCASKSKKSGASAPTKFSCSQYHFSASTANKSPGKRKAPLNPFHREKGAACWREPGRGSQLPVPVEDRRITLATFEYARTSQLRKIFASCSSGKGCTLFYPLLSIVFSIT